MNLEESWEQFEREFVHLQGCSPRTIKHYKTAFNRLAPYAQDGVTAEAIALWVEEMRGEDLKPSTINLYLDAMSSFCRWLTRKGLIQVNPFDGFKRKRPEIQPPRALRWTEAVTAIENCYGGWYSERDAAFLDFLLNTGARSSEATALTLDKLNLEDYKVTFENTKGREPRVVYFGKKYAERLTKYLEWRKAHWSDSPYLFPSRYGAQLPSKAAQAIPRRYGIPWNLHQFRHTYATEVLRKTGNLRLVQLLLGHKSIATTTRYLQVWDEDKMAAANALEDMDETQKVNKRGKRVG